MSDARSPCRTFSSLPLASAVYGGRSMRQALRKDERRRSGELASAARSAPQAISHLLESTSASRDVTTAAATADKGYFQTKAEKLENVKPYRPTSPRKRCDAAQPSSPGKTHQVGSVGRKADGSHFSVGHSETEKLLPRRPEQALFAEEHVDAELNEYKPKDALLPKLTELGSARTVKAGLMAEDCVRPKTSLSPDFKGQAQKLMAKKSSRTSAAGAEVEGGRFSFKSSSSSSPYATSFREQARSNTLSMLLPGQPVVVPQPPKQAKTPGKPRGSRRRAYRSATAASAPAGAAAATAGAGGSPKRESAPLRGVRKAQSPKAARANSAVATSGAPPGVRARILRGISSLGDLIMGRRGAAAAAAARDDTGEELQPLTAGASSRERPSDDVSDSSSLESSLFSLSSESSSAADSSTNVDAAFNDVMLPTSAQSVNNTNQNNHSAVSPPSASGSKVRRPKSGHKPSGVFFRMLTTSPRAHNPNNNNSDDVSIEWAFFPVLLVL